MADACLVMRKLVCREKRGFANKYDLVQVREKLTATFAFPPDPRSAGVRLKDKFDKMQPFRYVLHDGKGFPCEDKVNLEKSAGTPGSARAPRGRRDT
jgi:hypothetical protein